VTAHLTHRPAPRNSTAKSTIYLAGEDKPVADVYLAADCAQRLVAAWNACDGLDTGLIEGMGVGAFMRAADRMGAERERTRDLLVRLLAWAETTGGWEAKVWDEAREAVEGRPVPASAIKRAEEFIAGFEDDETQEGVTSLLADLRRLIAGQLEPAAPEVWTLSWDVRNANEPTGTQVFATEQLAIDQAMAWIDGDLGNYESEEDLLADLKENGYAELTDDRSYSIDSSRVRTKIDV
jgi:hypothetical protein